MAVFSAGRRRIKHWCRVMRAGCPSVLWVVGYLSFVVGGSVLITVAWGLKHLLWGLILLLIAVVTAILEGSYRESRDMGNASRTELDEQRRESEAALETVQKAYEAEQDAHNATKAALQAELQSPVSPEHRDRLKGIAQRQVAEISGGYRCRYFDSADPYADTKDMLAGHFPDLVSLLDIWDEALAEQGQAFTEFLTMVKEFISERMSSAPWEPEQIFDAFRQRAEVYCEVTEPGTREFTLNLTEENGKMLWRFAQSKPALHYHRFEIFNSEKNASLYRHLFEKAFDGFRLSPEFVRLNTASQTVHDIRQPALDSARKVEQRVEIYGRCSACSNA